MAKKKTSQADTFATRIDIPGKVRTALINVLSQQLADTLDVYSQTKQAHWNVKGREFYQLHELFDTFAGDLLGHIDDIAERITALGGTARGTVRHAAQVSRVAELPDVLGTSKQAIATLADRYADLAKSTRDAIEACDEIDDAGSEDLLTGISRDLDKKLWFLEAHLQDAE